MIHKPVGGCEHPVPADDIEVAFGDGVDVAAAADAGILVEDIIDLPAQRQPVAEEIPVDKGIPQEGGIILVEEAGLLPPVIIPVGIDLEVFDGEDGKLCILALGPVAGQYAGVDRALAI